MEQQIHKHGRATNVSKRRLSNRMAAKRFRIKKKEQTKVMEESLLQLQQERQELLQQLKQLQYQLKQSQMKVLELQSSGNTDTKPASSDGTDLVAAGSGSLGPEYEAILPSGSGSLAPEYKTESRQPAKQSTQSTSSGEENDTIPVPQPRVTESQMHCYQLPDAQYIKQQCGQVYFYNPLPRNGGSLTGNILNTKHDRQMHQADSHQACVADDNQYSAQVVQEGQQPASGGAAGESLTTQSSALLSDVFGAAILSFDEDLMGGSMMPADSGNFCSTLCGAGPLA